MKIVTIFEGPSPIDGERWLRREVAIDREGCLHIRDAGPGWQDQAWTQCAKDATVEQLRPTPHHVEV